MKKIALGVMLPFLLLGSFLVNIYIHEYGHYAVADHYGLNPEVHFGSSELDNSRLNLYSPAAYTSYASNSAELVKQDAIIAFAGPLVNLILALIICGVYLIIPKQKRNFWVQACFAMALIPCFASFVINLLPLGFSDGSIIYSALFQ